MEDAVTETTEEPGRRAHLMSPVLTAEEIDEPIFACTRCGERDPETSCPAEGM